MMVMADEGPVRPIIRRLTQLGLATSGYVTVVWTGCRPDRSCALRPSRALLAEPASTGAGGPRPAPPVVCSWSVAVPEGVNADDLGVEPDRHLEGHLLVPRERTLREARSNTSSSPVVMEPHCSTATG